MYRNRFCGRNLMMGDEIGSPIDIDGLLACGVFRTVYTNFHVDRERRISELPYRNLVVPALYPAKTGTMRFRPMAGLVGCVF